MGKRYIDSGVKCPHYCSEGPGKIYCEGCEPKQWVHLAWESESRKKEHKKMHCRNDWQSCPLAKLPRMGSNSWQKGGANHGREGG